jgi:pilus assembly protein CpaB
MTFIGLGMAGGAVYMAQNQMNAADAERQSDSTVRVIAAAQDIPFGAPLEGHLLTSIVWPADAVPPGAFTDFDDVLPGNGGEPRRAKRTLAQGEILLTAKISEFGEKVTIVQTLKENNRAMAIEVDAQSGVGGFVTPGDFVDIVMTQGRAEEMRAVTVLQNIRVIGVDQQADEQIDQPGVARTVTVEVSPEQGQKLALAQQAGRLSLTLRSLNTADDRPLQAVRLSDILHETQTEDAPSRPVVRVRRGASEVEEVTLN